MAGRRRARDVTPSGSAPRALRGRHPEQEVLDRVVEDVRAGQSRVLVVRGEAGVGKSALLDYLADQATTGQVVRAAGVEHESEIAYAALQQVCSPLMGFREGLAPPQRLALETAFGMSAGDPPEALLVGLAVLSLLAEAAAERPLVCVVDDAHWVDRMSKVILAFVARRLEKESVALVFGIRSPDDERVLDGLPELRVEGLGDSDARLLLDSVLLGPVDSHVRDRIIVEARGNPLALLELPRGVDPAELAFGFGSHTPKAPSSRVEEGFERRIRALPAETRTVLLTAAVEPVGDVSLLWRALSRLGVRPESSVAAETAGLVSIGTRVVFRHPLVRSACRSCAGASELRAVHAALAEETDPERDPDRRAWHLAHAALGPDESVAGELERSADRAMTRGGRAAAAAFLERAAQLTPDPSLRATRTLAAAHARYATGALSEASDLLAAAELGPLDVLQQASVERLRAKVAFSANDGRTAGPQLLNAAQRLERLDASAARETYLAAITAAVNAGRLGGDGLRLAAQAGRAAPAGEEPAGLMLTALSTWVLDGHARAVPSMLRVLDEVEVEADPDLAWLSAAVSHMVWDDEAFLTGTERSVLFARTTGRLSLLPPALSFRAVALLHCGRLGEAADLIEESMALARVTGVDAHPVNGVLLAAYRGQEKRALDLNRALSRYAEASALGWELAVAAYGRSLLYNGLGRYGEALTAALEAVEHEDLANIQWALSELVEAAARSGAPEVASDARARLTARTSAVDTAWARGTQAVADALGDPAGPVEERFQEATHHLGRTQMRVQLARARLLYGEWLRREKRPSDAREQLQQAHEIFAAVGAESFAQRAARELGAAGGTVHSRVRGAREELTAQEGQIARLAASGRTNPEIGTALFLSPRTVEWHLRKIYTKLDITSRRELAGVLHDG